MKFQPWPKRDPDKNYFKVPNEVFHIGLSYPEISIYCYLLSIEDRETYQCYPSYKTIGKALGEYSDYKDKPTKANASVFITRALEGNWS